MSNEALVEQLRKLAPICRGQAEIYIEKAADEIERMLAKNAELQKLLDSAENAMAKGVALHRGDSENPADYCRCDSCTWLNRYLMHKTIRARSAKCK